MYKDLDYRPESYALAVNYANRLSSEMESAKSECLGILSGLNPPEDLDISGEISSLREIIESMSTRVGEIRTIIKDIREEIESRDAEIASKLDSYIKNEEAYVHNTEIERIAGSKPNPKDYADGEKDEAYIKDLEKYETAVAAYEAFSEGKIDYNYLKSTYGEEIATKIQLEYGKQHGSTVGEGESLVEIFEGVATKAKYATEKVKDAAVLLVTDPLEFYVKTRATITNAGVAVVKGGLGLVEDVFDLGVGIGGAVGAGVAKLTGHEDKAKKISEKLSGFISTNWVDKGCDLIYNTAGGKWLDSKSIIKHDSKAFDTIAGLGKMAGLIIISGVATPAVGALVAGAAAGGETIEKDFQNLGGSTSDLGEYTRAVLHGTLSGALEGGMWYAGSKVGLSGDLALSAVDPVTRTGVQMISPTENRSFKEIFNEDYGGTKGILTNMFFSVLGNKFSDKFSASKSVDIETNTKMKPDIEINGKKLAEIEDSTSALWASETMSATNSQQIYKPKYGNINAPETYGYQKKKWYSKLSDIETEKNNNSIQITQKVDDVVRAIDNSLYKAGITDPVERYFYKQGMTNDLISSTVGTVHGLKGSDNIAIIDQRMAIDSLDNLKANMDTYIDYQIKRQELLNVKINKLNPTEIDKFQYFSDDTLNVVPNLVKFSKNCELVDYAINNYIAKNNFKVNNMPNSKERTYFLANGHEFRKALDAPKGASGGNTFAKTKKGYRNITAFSLDNDGDVVKTLAHEEDHGLLRKPDGTSGIMTKNGGYLGLNEGLNEHFTQGALKSFGYKPKVTSYKPNVDFLRRLEKLIDMDEGYYFGQSGAKVIGDAYVSCEAENVKSIFKNLLSSGKVSSEYIDYYVEDYFDDVVKNTDIIADPKMWNDFDVQDQAKANLEKLSNEFMDAYLEPWKIKELYF